MSMPQQFYVAIISYDFETSSIVTAALGGPGYIGGISPYLVSTCMHGTISKLDKTFLLMAQKYGIHLQESYYYKLIDPRKIDLWIAMDRISEEAARQHVGEFGLVKSSFYHNYFGDVVVYANISLPKVPKESQFPEDWQKWFSQIKERVSPWSKKLWDAFSDSS
ncbi:MAG: hypothetical protein ACOYYF_03480 [Chloroflexota bacterium]|nr:hypothetical protein [Chloroflexota bacterium]MBI5703736.1 hypothetical protein [Chloroflexota bacterium]